MTIKAPPAPTDLAYPGLTVDDLCLRVDEGIYGEVQDGNRPRATAISNFANEAGLAFTEVRCRVRYLRFMTRQDVWNGPGRDRWCDDRINQHLIDHGTRLPLTAAWKDVPGTPPDDWRPGEYDPCWEFCEKTHPEAIRAWICEQKPRSIPTREAQDD